MLSSLGITRHALGHLLACTILLSELIVYATEVATSQVLLCPAVVLVARLVSIHGVCVSALILEDRHVLDVHGLRAEWVLEFALSLVHSDGLGLDACPASSSVREPVGWMEEGVIASERAAGTRRLRDPSLVSDGVLLSHFGFLDVGRPVPALLDITVSGHLVLVD